MKDNPYIKKLVNNIAEHCNELKKVYLISNKINTNGKLTSFKLAIIVDNSVENNSELECRLYLNIDCELPFDWKWNCSHAVGHHLCQSHHGSIVRTEQ